MLPFQHSRYYLIFKIAVAKPEIFLIAGVTFECSTLFSHSGDHDEMILLSDAQ